MAAAEKHDVTFKGANDGSKLSAFSVGKHTFPVGRARETDAKTVELLKSDKNKERYEFDFAKASGKAEPSTKDPDEAAPSGPGGTAPPETPPES